MRSTGLRSGLVWALCLGLPACAARTNTSASAASAAAPAPQELTEDALDVGYLCPMHPDHTSEAPGTCPRCGMALVLGRPFDMRDYRLVFRTVPELPKAGVPIRLEFQVLPPDEGAAVKKFELVHDRPYHLFVISQDMDFFEHLHPEQKDDTWSMEVTLPKPGYYTLLSDFFPSGGSAQFLTQPLVTAGYDGDLLSQRAQLVPDASASQTVDDLTTTVTFAPPVFRAGDYGHLTFELRRSDTGEPVQELQPYLGAFGHMLIMSEDMVDYVHAHPVEGIPPSLGEPRGGPTVTFEGLMPKPGRYRAWTQFRYRDRIYTFVKTFSVLETGAIP